MVGCLMFINFTPITQVEYKQFLGVHIDHLMTWKVEYILVKIAAKIVKNVGILTCIAHRYCQKQVKSAFYFMLLSTCPLTSFTST